MKQYPIPSSLNRVEGSSGRIKIIQTLFGFCITLVNFSYSMQKPDCFSPQPKDIIKQKWEKKIQEDVVGYALERDKEEKEQDRIRTQQYIQRKLAKIQKRELRRRHKALYNQQVLESIGKRLEELDAQLAQGKKDLERFQQLTAVHTQAATQN